MSTFKAFLFKQNMKRKRGLEDWNPNWHLPGLMGLASLEYALRDWAAFAPSPSA
jgi:hypothetical protein